MSDSKSEQPFGGGLEKEMRILLAVDGSRFSDAAVDEVCARPWPVGSELKVVSAFQVPLSATAEVWALPDQYFETLEKAARGRAQAVVEGAETTLKARLDNSVKLTSEIIAGPPREAILDEANRWKADLIVLGSHGYGAWQRFLLGSVSQAVVSHGTCSVEVVHIRPEEKAEAA